VANQTLPPPADPLASSLFLRSALRTQSDRRLARLVREGYEAAFEEIVRRYRRPLDRFAAAIVGSRSEDVVQDSFSKALLALRRSDTEIELRPWLYRIVRNTALNDLRDRPPAAEELGDDHVAGGRSAAAEAESRAQFGELTAAVRALPDPQRSAIVMRELEGRSHDEIAGALGVSGGAARQAIHRARTTLRAGFGALLPLPLLRVLADHGAVADRGAEAAGAAAGGASGLGGGMLGAGGIGAGGAVKLGLATALVAGGIGAGVAAQNQGGGNKAPTEAVVSKTATPSPRAVPNSAAGGPAGGSARDASFAPADQKSSSRGTGGGDRGHSAQGQSGEGHRSSPRHAADGHRGPDSSVGTSDSGSSGSGSSGPGPSKGGSDASEDGGDHGGSRGGHGSSGSEETSSSSHSDGSGGGNSDSSGGGHGGNDSGSPSGGDGGDGTSGGDGASSGPGSSGSDGSDSGAVAPAGSAPEPIPTESDDLSTGLAPEASPSGPGDGSGSTSGGDSAAVLSDSSGGS
jgi:RNA polymerase sigma factor (sigma-70 family)